MEAYRGEVVCTRSHSSLGSSGVEKHAGPLQRSVCRSPSSDRQGRDGVGGPEGHLKPVLNLCLVCPSPPLLTAHSGAHIQCVATTQAPAARGPSPVTSTCLKSYCSQLASSPQDPVRTVPLAKHNQIKLIPCPLLSSKGSGSEAGHGGRGPWPVARGR